MSEINRPDASRLVDKIYEETTEKGWSHLQTGIDPEDMLAIRGLFVAMDNRRVASTKKPEITSLSPHSHSLTLATSSQEMSFHTDNVYLEEPCQRIALFCAIQAEEGGYNELIDGLAITRTLSQETRDALRTSQWSWTDPSTGKPSLEFSVLNEDKEAIRWWRTSLLNRDIGSLAVADTLEEALNTSDERTRVLMQPGEVLVTDNTRILHNRSAFVGNRRIYRARFW